VGRYDHEQRVAIIAGPHRYSTGVVHSTIPATRDKPEQVSVELDCSGRVVVVPAEHVRAEVYAADDSGLGDAT
jgi:hypothetical protein